MRILAIETSCDDTSIALVEANLSTSQVDRLTPKFEVLQSIVSSQTRIHRHWGGVVPNLAKREHIRSLPIIFKKISPEFIEGKPKLDVIAVTVGPGLEPALWTGIEFAKKLSTELNVPLVGANHLEGHLYASLLPQTRIGHPEAPTGAEGSPKKILQPMAVGFRMTDRARFPAIALIVSGGHTILLLMKDLLHWKLLGETRDDAVGEAFDKVARMLGLPYPGGPEIEKLAKKGNPNAIKFPRPMLHEKNYDFSFSGLKTAVLYYARDKQLVPERGQKAESKDINNIALRPSLRQILRRARQAQGVKSAIADIAASFQQAAIDVLVSKTIRAVREFGAQSVILCGGVAANTTLRETLQKAASTAGATFIAPAMEYNTDNAAMIAAAAYMQMLRKQRNKKAKKQELPMEANGNLSL